MRYVIALWAAPLAIFWSWYFLSLHDMNFGYLILSRQVHDFVFQMYGEILGVNPAEIPTFVAHACIFDGIFLSALLAFRRRKRIAAWWRKGNAIAAEVPVAAIETRKARWITLF